MTDLTKLEAHPFADIFPMIAPKQLDELAASIGRDGLLDKVVLFGGKILDGRNRYAALQKLGWQIDARDEKGSWLYFANFGGNEDEALSFVESKNMARRHLNPSQKALAAATFAKMRMGDKYHQHTGFIEAEQDAAKKFNAPVSSVTHARKVMQRSTPNLIRMAQQGDLRLHQLRQLSDELTEDEQKKLRTPAQAQKAVAALREETGRFGKVGPAAVLDTCLEAVSEIVRRDVATFVEAAVANDNALQDLETAIASLTKFHDEMSRALGERKAQQAAG